MVHIVWKFPEAEIGGSQSDTVSLLQQEMAKCVFDIQQIKVNLNKLSSLKTKEQLNKYNKHVEQLEKARKVYQFKVQEFEELQLLLL